MSHVSSMTPAEAARPPGRCHIDGCPASWAPPGRQATITL